MRFAAIWLAVLLTGCKREQPSPEPSMGQIALAASPAWADADAGGYRIAPEKLEAFIQYQRKINDLYAAMLHEVERLTDGGTKQALASLQQKAEVERKAREELRLSDEEVNQLEQIVGEVIATRTMVKGLGQDDTISRMEKMRKAISADQQAGFDQALAEMKKQRDESVQLHEARRKYGDKNVDAVLSREKELTDNWNALLGQLTGSKAR